MAKVNWDAVRTEYVTGAKSLRALAEKYGIAPSTIYERSSKEGWAARRRAFRSKAVAKAEEKAEDELAEAIALIPKAGLIVLRRFLQAFEDEGFKLPPGTAERWAKLILEYAATGRTPDIQQIIVKWVADEGEGDQDILCSPPETEDVS